MLQQNSLLTAARPGEVLKLQIGFCDARRGIFRSLALLSGAPKERLREIQAGRSMEHNHADLVVIGAGPGGYAAAFRAADLGRDVVLVDARNDLGGVCLNEGCIPSKALLHAAEVIHQARHMSAWGVTFAEPDINLEALRAQKDKIVGRLTGGLSGLTKLVYCPKSQRVLGASIVGPAAGELLSEVVVAMEMGACLEDLSLTIHAHPTLSETIPFAAARALGTLTDL